MLCHVRQRQRHRLRVAEGSRRALQLDDDANRRYPPTNILDEAQKQHIRCSYVSVIQYDNKQRMDEQFSAKDGNILDILDLTLGDKHLYTWRVHDPGA